jgi:hypothetical protein
MLTLIPSRTQINGMRVTRGESCILRDRNEIMFGSPMQQQNPLKDYWFIYQCLALKELTGIDVHYNTMQELGRGTFVTVMKATWASGGLSRSSMRRSSTRRTTITKPTAALAAADATAIAALLPQGRIERERDQHVGETFVVSARRTKQSKS